MPYVSNIYLFFACYTHRSAKVCNFLSPLRNCNRVWNNLYFLQYSQNVLSILQSRPTTCFIKMILSLKPFRAGGRCFSVRKEMTITIFLRNRAMHYNTYCESRSLHILNSFSILCFTPYIQYSSHVTATIIEK